MMINQKKLKEIFTILPNVNVFLSNKERSVRFTSSFEDVGGRDDDVFQNIKAISKGDCNADIAIEKFYSLGRRTVIQLQIGGEQKAISDIINGALDAAMLTELAKIFFDRFRLVNYFTNLKHIVYRLVDRPDDILDRIDKYIDFAYLAKEAESFGDKGHVYNLYKLFCAEEFIPPESDDIADALDLYNILNTDEGIVPQETVYPINMRYINGKLSTEIVACISNACYKITSFTCEERDISNIDIDNNDFVDEYLSKVFTEETAEFVSNILTEYFMISIFAERTADGDIIIKFVDGEDIVCLARITPTKETIIW